MLDHLNSTVETLLSNEENISGFLKDCGFSDSDIEHFKVISEKEKRECLAEMLASKTSVEAMERGAMKDRARGEKLLKHHWRQEGD